MGGACLATAIRPSPRGETAPSHALAFHVLRAAPQNPARERPGNRRKLPVDTPALALVVSRHAR